MTKWVLILLAAIFLVGFHMMPAWIGTVVVLTALLMTGLLYRLLKLFAGGLLILIGLGA